MGSIVEAYDRLERAKRSNLSVPEVQAFQTTTFDRVGWPHRVERIEDVVRYVDWCCHPDAGVFFAPDARIPTQCAHLMFSDVERDLLQHLSRMIASFTSRFGREVHPLLSHVAQIGPFRIVSEIRRRLGGAPLSIFEIGAGSGYLPALLGMTGNTIKTSDNAQGLFLFQHTLLQECFGSEYASWVEAGAATQARLQTIPWWDFLSLRHHGNMKIDVVISNNNLGELNPLALAYSLRVAKHLMRDSKVKLFIFTSGGTPMHQDINGVRNEFLRAGYRAVITEPFHAYCPKEHVLSEDLLNFEPDAPLYLHKGEKLHSVRDVLLVTPETMPVEMDFVSYCDVFTCPPLKDPAISRSS